MFVLLEIWIILECLINMRRVKQEVVEYQSNNSFDIKKTRVTVRDIVSEMSVVRSKDKSITVSTDISLLFNQQRLENRLSVDELRTLINRYTPNASVYLNQLDDDLLLDSLKSRHVQSLSEMKAWTEYCMEEFSDLIDKSKVDKEQPQEQQQHETDVASDS